VSSRAANIPTAAASWTNSPNLFFIIRFLYRPIPRSTAIWVENLPINLQTEK
jgi:hypothetical protein